MIDQIFGYIFAQMSKKVKVHEFTSFGEPETLKLDSFLRTRQFTYVEFNIKYYYIEYHLYYLVINN